MDVRWFVTRQPNLFSSWHGSKWVRYSTLPLSPLRPWPPTTTVALTTTPPRLPSWAWILGPTASHHTVTTNNIVPPTRPRQCRLPWTRKKAEGGCGQWYAYGPSQRIWGNVFPSFLHWRSTLHTCPVQDAAPLVFSSSHKWHPSIGCDNYLLDFLHHTVSIVVYYTLNKIHCGLQNLWTGLTPSKMMWQGKSHERVTHFHEILYKVIRMFKILGDTAAEQALKNVCLTTTTDTPSFLSTACLTLLLCCNASRINVSQL
jgi:hypothetical protein